MNKIIITSTNPNKISAVKSVFSEYDINSISVNTIIKQPKSIEETIETCKYRIKQVNNNEDIIISLEAGCEKINNKCFLINFGILKYKEYEFIGGGTFIPLPDDVKDLIYNDNLELKDAIQIKINDLDINKHNGTIGYLTNNYVNRCDIFIHICKLLRGQLEKNIK